MLHIGGAFMALMIAVVFTLFLNGDIGWALIYILGGTSVLSLVLFFVSKRHFRVSLADMSGVTECGRKTDIEITLKKTGFCILPFIELTVDAGSAELPVKIRTALIFGKEKRVSASFRPMHGGLNKVSVTEAMLRDLLGLARKRAKLDLHTQKAVLPRIVEYDGPEIFPNMLPSEEEETEEGAVIQSGGMPGYEHRDYVPGDSPRRVNYKLSAKKNKLMVRLDENPGTAATNLYIAENGMPICADKAFALANKLVLHGGTVKLTHKGEERTASTLETLERMREWLAFREYADRPDAAFGAPPPADTAVTFSGGGNITN